MLIRDRSKCSNGFRLPVFLEPQNSQEGREEKEEEPDDAHVHLNPEKQSGNSQAEDVGVDHREELCGNWRELAVQEEISNPGEGAGWVGNGIEKSGAQPLHARPSSEFRVACGLQMRTGRGAQPNQQSLDVA